MLSVIWPSVLMLSNQSDDRGQTKPGFGLKPTSPSRDQNFSHQPFRCFNDERKECSSMTASTLLKAKV